MRKANAILATVFLSVSLTGCMSQIEQEPTSPPEATESATPTPTPQETTEPAEKPTEAPEPTPEVIEPEPLTQEQALQAVEDGTMTPGDFCASYVPTTSGGSQLCYGIANGTHDPITGEAYPAPQTDSLNEHLSLGGGCNSDYFPAGPPTPSALTEIQSHCAVVPPQGQSAEDYFVENPGFAEFE